MRCRRAGEIDAENDDLRTNRRISHAERKVGTGVDRPLDEGVREERRGVIARVVDRPRARRPRRASEASSPRAQCAADDVVLKSECRNSTTEAMSIRAST
jgi:hypothetical protein